MTHELAGLYTSGSLPMPVRRYTHPLNGYRRSCLGATGSVPMPISRYIHHPNRHKIVFVQWV
jgi:hypothetical protein